MQAALRNGLNEEKDQIPSRQASQSSRRQILADLKVFGAIELGELIEGSSALNLVNDLSRKEFENMQLQRDLRETRERLSATTIEGLEIQIQLAQTNEHLKTKTGDDWKQSRLRPAGGSCMQVP